MTPYKIPEIRSASRKDGSVITDLGNMIVDVSFPSGIQNPADLEKNINMIPGVVDNGIFSAVATLVLVAVRDGGNIKVMNLEEFLEGLIWLGPRYRYPGGFASIPIWLAPKAVKLLRFNFLMAGLITCPQQANYMKSMRKAMANGLYLNFEESRNQKVGLGSVCSALFTLSFRIGFVKCIKLVRGYFDPKTRELHEQI
ncbi:RIBOSE-5-PHOSPHATE ISOMERASE [Salix purpurea]|uniref:RIBOSE-5-PHOSPHATE ISOMERASE n=1 Tax=Salix purpurea TaxID=77065 RepID=A0A9Q0Q541_SALPP|nr:RIBOSE-5-PHOSPHATE ISOMERASE [Salix purpurea]